MKIKIRYETTFTTLEVPEEEFSLMIETDYAKRLENASEGETIERRTPQEIIDEQINRVEYNNWHRTARHFTTVSAKDRFASKCYSAGKVDEGDGVSFWDMLPDPDNCFRSVDEDDVEGLCALLHEKLGSKHAEILIAVHIQGMKLKDFAALKGWSVSDASHRLARAEKYFQKFFQKPSTFWSSRGYIV